MESIKVLLVEDDPMVREVNRQFIERVEGFKIIAMCSNGEEGYNQIIALRPDLVIMDIFMPEQDGLITLRKIRNSNLPVDVITVTAANDMQTIQQILHLGVYDYIMKPFTFERMQQTLLNYCNFKMKTFGVQDITQKELDEMIHPYREMDESTGNEPTLMTELPKGFNRTTLDKVLLFVKASKEGVSADEVAAGIGVARVTARRYLDFLEKQNFIQVDVHYGGVGRPINHYYV
ncbi:response regulator [Ureibacillus aquaedulcis]|uniref:Transcriptional regulatory protein n=1 Tax=Ureibacillus aquaedulcis TaxID=3058421 RepID=A0ABT8GPB2_9BACL|nr:response regulator [Ureibacillus sp. BA0131]MDN4493247.1 response regulator [Ureibacillus sp. BA0131]